ncbi:MOSC domain-containing protein [Algoriphagus sp. NBT04N3]|uniref:MOSC domain-containing protein n=1 Tax=Algoriphagus sp. NBT04N3 TaxID=2705473 RepID=UPI0021037186|nr:MOSC N-terminal beta barrel domain-containing protein [Algoriphagus sp. NBT04N3]
MSQGIFLQDIYIYPIKSLGGIRMEVCRVEERGFEFDRRWMLIDPQGRFVTQREYPRLALLKVQLESDFLKVYSSERPEDYIQIPLILEGYESVEVVVWDDTMLAKKLDPNIDRWFSEKLGMGVHLVKMPETTHRLVSPKYAVKNESVSFADGMPYLLIGQESLDDLNTRLERTVPMDRFRPNLVFSGAKAYEEDSWKTLKVGEVDFQIVKPCARCVMTTIDQENATKSKEPLKTLASYRTVNSKVLFGQNMVALSHGILKIGDSVQVISS